MTQNSKLEPANHHPLRPDVSLCQNFTTAIAALVGACSFMAYSKQLKHTTCKVIQMFTVFPMHLLHLLANARSVPMDCECLQASQVRSYATQ